MRPQGPFGAIRPEPTARSGTLLRAIEEAMYTAVDLGDRAGRRDRQRCEAAAREHRLALESIAVHPGLIDFAATCSSPWPALRHHIDQALGSGAPAPIKHLAQKARRWRDQALSRKAAPQRMSSG